MSKRTPLRIVELPHRCPRPVRMAALSHASYFTGLGEDVLDDVDKQMRTVSYSAGERIYTAGEPADALYVVAVGRVKLTRSGADGAEWISDIVVSGELFGALGSLGEPYHLESAEALVDTCLLTIGPDEFRSVLTTYPPIALRVLDDVAARLAHANSKSVEPVPQRVARALLHLAKKVGRREGPRLVLDVPLTRADIAGLADSTPESVSRVMSKWKREGIIDSGRRWTAIIDEDALVDLAM